MSVSIPIVGIGASAGGLEALRAFVEAIPDDAGPAFVVVQHLAPDHPSIMDKLLASHTSVPVRQIADGMPVEANVIYIIPPGPFVELENGAFRLIEHDRETGIRTPIDRFFDSLADAKGRDAFGVILSGTGSDGTHGVRAIKRAGGIAIVQASEGARFPGMPDSAAATGLVDFALPAEKIPERILDILRHRETLGRDEGGNGLQDEIEARISEMIAAVDPGNEHRFDRYKVPTLVRRIQRRMTLLRETSVDAYIARLDAEAEERAHLSKDFRIGVTEFFRDPDVYAAVEQRTVAELVARADKAPIRIWVPGCATGEEAYSLAILLVEEMERQNRRRPCQVFGTDVDMTALRHARAGVYASGTMSRLSPDRRERFFREEANGLHVATRLREMCVFAPHDILRDPPFSRLDMISCRNVMIYLTSEAQRSVLPRFHYGLNPGGYLLLGPSESLGDNEELFETVDRNARLFQRNDKASTRFTALDAPTPRPTTVPATPAADLWTPTAQVSAKAGQSIDLRAEQAFLASFAAPFALVEADGRILYLSEAMTAFVAPARGAPEPTIDSFLTRALRLPAQAVLAEVQDTGAAAEARNVVTEIDGERRLFDVLAKPLDDEGPGTCLLVLREVRLRDGDEIRPEADRAADTDLIERKLVLANRQLDAMQNEYSSAEQQLRSANEELLSMNEELQSSNEELETSREELQSINEELETINAELTENNRQLTRANSDMRNLLESTDIATLFLDSRLRVRLFTPSLSALYGVRERDIGREITDLASRVSYPDLAADAASVLQTLKPVEREVRVEATGQVYTVRMRPYRTIDDRLDGTVITFVDITGRKRNEEQLAENARVLRKQYAELETLYDSIPLGLSLLDRDLRYLRINPALAEINGYPVEAHIGKYAPDLLPDVDDTVKRMHEQVFETGQPMRGVEVSGETPKEPGKTRHWLVDYFPVMDGDEVFAVGSSVLEVTEQRELEQEVARAAAGVAEREARLRRIFDTVPALVAMHEGPDHVFLYSNPSHDRTTGHRDLIGKPLREAFADLAGTDIYDAFDTVYRTGESSDMREIEVSLDNPDGRTPPAHFTQQLHPWFDDTGAVGGVMSFAYDVTEQVEARKKVEAIATALAESEARLKRMFDAVPVFISMHEGPEHVFVYSNPANNEAIGGREVVGKSLEQAFPDQPEAIAEIRRPFDEVFSSGKPLTRAEVRGARQDPTGAQTGEPLWFNHAQVPYFDGDGNVLGVMSFAFDVTEQVEARMKIEGFAAKLTESEARMNSLFNQAPAIVSIFEGPDLRYLYVNDAHDEAVGKPRADLIGKPLREAMPELEGQDIFERFEQVFATGTPIVTDELPAQLDESGRTQWFRQRISPWYTHDGSIGGVMSFNTDVTDLVEAREDVARGERRLRTIQDSLQSFLGLLDTDGRLIEINSLALERADLTRDDVIGKPFWECFWWSYSPDMQDTLKVWFQRALAGETLREECEVRLAGGEMILIDFHLEPSFDATGNVVEVIPSAIDISQWRAAEARKDTLMAELQHRVKNTLATVQAIARFTARKAPSKEALIESLQQRLSAMSRTHDALTQSDWSGRSFAELVHAEIDPYLDDHEGRLEIVGEDARVPPAMALSLALALHELTTNAAKYGALSGEQGKVRITVAAESRTLKRIFWEEIDGPEVTAPKSEGFGSFLLKRVLESDLDAEVDLQFAEAGVTCEIVFRHVGR